MWNLKRIDKSYRDDFIEKFSQTFNVYYKAGEITNDFYKKVRKKEFLALINDTKTFKKMLELKLKVAELKKKRRDIFSIHVGFKRLRVRILGKQIARFG